MKLSLAWLSQYIGHGLTDNELSHRLTMAGLEVEGVSRVGDDVVFEIEVTPNRADCLNVLGLAREVAAITDRDVCPPAVQEYDDSGDLAITIEDAAACGCYIGTLIDGIQVKAFPADKSKYLQAIGLKPISNIVDLTNFVLFEYGQPLHAFDFDKLAGGQIIVRRARKGEKIVTLDDVTRELESSVLVIADAEKPVAIAGIMGGRDTAVSSSTKRILLESAYFDLGVVRRACRKLGMTSDSAYRFERGVAWKTVETGANRATDLILELAGGAVVARKDVVAKNPEAARTEITVSVDDIQNLLGAPLELARCEKILKRLGCIVAVSRKELTIVPPHFRSDLRIKQDVIEEVARVIGYDNLPMSLPNVQATNISVDQDRERFFSQLEQVLIGQGLNQIMTYGLVSRTALEKSLSVEVTPVALQNPMSAEQEILRPTMLPSFLGVAAANIRRGQKDLGLFEVAKRYSSAGERWTLGVLLAGRMDDDWRRSKKNLADFYDLKGVLEGIMTVMRIGEASFVPAEDVRFEAGQCADVCVKGRVVGRFGRLSEQVMAGWDIKKAAVYFSEVDAEDLRDAVTPRDKFDALDEFPAVVRDLSLAVKDTAFADIRGLCLANGQGLLRKIDFVELYAGDKMEPGHKGYVLSLTYQSKERTLTDDEVNALHEGMIQKLIDTFGVKRR